MGCLSRPLGKGDYCVRDREQNHSEFLDRVRGGFDGHAEGPWVWYQIDIGFRAVPSAQTSPEHSSSIAICNDCFANHIRTASTKAAIHNMDAAITVRAAPVNFKYLATWLLDLAT